jgi:hypothetical protein
MASSSRPAANPRHLAACLSKNPISARGLSLMCTRTCSAVSRPKSKFATRPFAKADVTSAASPLSRHIGSHVRPRAWGAVVMGPASENLDNCSHQDVHAAFVRLSRSHRAEEAPGRDGHARWGAVPPASCRAPSRGEAVVPAEPSPLCPHRLSTGDLLCPLQSVKNRSWLAKEWIKQASRGSSLGQRDLASASCSAGPNSRRAKSDQPIYNQPIGVLAHDPISCPHPNSSRISAEIGHSGPDRGRLICHARKHQNCQVRRPLLSNSNATARIADITLMRRLRSLFR